MSSYSAQGLFKASRALLAAATKTASATAKPKKPRSKPLAESAKPAAAEGRKATSGILKVSPVSPAMRDFLGAPEASRTHAVKKVWEYIKLHNLQTPADKRVILCDDKLKTIFDGKEKVGFLEIGKLLSSHFVKTEV